MKKTFILLTLSILLSALIFTPAYAGDINDEEQAILVNLSSDIEYHGKTYYADADYISSVKAYLSRDDVDLSSTEVSLYMEQFNENIYSYVRDGYLLEKSTITENNTDAPQKDNDKNDSSQNDNNKKTASEPTKKTSDKESVSTNTPDTSMETTSTKDENPSSNDTSQFSIEDIEQVESPFMNYIDSNWFVIIIFLFIFLAISYIAINRKIIFHKLAFLKVILLFACTCGLLICSLTTLFFANDRYFEDTMTKSGYYEYIYAQTANYVKAQSKVFLIEEDVPGLTDYIISKRFSRSQIRCDVDSYTKNGSDKLNNDTVNESLKNLIDDFNKDIDLFSVSITNDNLSNWIYNVSVYYSDRISFDYARNIYLLRTKIRNYFTIAIAITGFILLIEILNLLINRKKHMLRRLQCVISAVLLTVPVLLIFILFAATGNIFILSNGTYSNSDNLYMQAAYESQIITNFKNSCVNSSFYFLMAFLIVICAFHFLVRYYSNKKYGTQ